MVITQVVRSASVHVRSRRVGYIRNREGTAIEITSSTSICTGPSGAILKVGASWCVRIYGD